MLTGTIAGVSQRTWKWIIDIYKSNFHRAFSFIFIKFPFPSTIQSSWSEIWTSILHNSIITVIIIIVAKITCFLNTFSLFVLVHSMLAWQFCILSCIFSSVWPSNGLHVTLTTCSEQVKLIIGGFVNFSKSSTVKISFKITCYELQITFSGCFGSPSANYII